MVVKDFPQNPLNSTTSWRNFLQGDNLLLKKSIATTTNLCINNQYGKHMAPDESRAIRDKSMVKFYPSSRKSLSKTKLKYALSEI